MFENFCKGAHDQRQILTFGAKVQLLFEERLPVTIALHMNFF